MSLSNVRFEADEIADGIRNLEQVMCAEGCIAPVTVGNLAWKKFGSSKAWRIVYDGKTPLNDTPLFERMSAIHLLPELFEAAKRATQEMVEKNQKAMEFLRGLKGPSEMPHKGSDVL